MFGDLLSNSDDDEEEKKLERQRKKLETIRERKKRAEQKRKAENESQQTVISEPRTKVDKPVRVCLSDALQWQLVLIGDDDKRDQFTRTQSKMKDFFCGKRNENESALHVDSLRKLFVSIFEKFEEASEEDEYSELKFLLNEFNGPYLKALMALSKIKENVNETVKNNYRFFEEAWLEAHQKRLAKKEDKFRDFWSLFAELNNAEEELRITEEATRETIENNLHFTKEIDIQSLVEELSELSINLDKENGKLRDTSPTRFENIISKDSMDKLISGTKHLRISRKERDEMESELGHCPTSASSSRMWSLGLSDSDSSVDENEDYGQALWRANEKMMKAPKKVRQVKIEVVDMEIDEDNSVDCQNDIQVIEIEQETKNEMDESEKRKKVEIVEYESPMNRMRIFCNPLDWFIVDGDESSTLCMDTSLSDGWKMLHDKYGNSPIVVQRKFSYGSFIEKNRQKDGIRLVVLKKDDVENDDDDDTDDCGPIYENSVMTENGPNHSESVEDQVRDNIYSIGEIMAEYNSSAKKTSLAFRTFYGREIIIERRPLNIFYRTLIREFVNYEVSTVPRTMTLTSSLRQKIEKDVINRIKTGDYGSVSTVWVITDWKLRKLKDYLLLNAKVFLVPTCLADLCFSVLKQAIRATFDAKTVNIKTIVFALGGYHNSEMGSIFKFLCYVYKLTASRNVNIHWISSDSCIPKEEQHESIQSIHNDNEGKPRFLDSNNQLIKSFVGKMRERGIENVHYAEISSWLRPEETRKIGLENLYFEHINYFEEKCGILLHSSIFPLQDRRRDRYMENQGRRPYK